jgi:hypothetical protein
MPAPELAAQEGPSVRSASMRLALDRVVAAWPSIAGAIAFRLACYAAMTALALWAEFDRGPVLHDALIARLPYVPWIDRANYVAWLVVYVPVSILFLADEPRRWVRYMITGGLVSLVRGVCIALTSIGAPDPAHIGPGIGTRSFASAYMDLLSPIGVFGENSAHAYLTQDLFFSGHAATTFLLVLYLWDKPRLRLVAIASHVAMVCAVLLAHLHYSIDILAAWAFTFAIFAVREWMPRAGARASSTR